MKNKIYKWISIVLFALCGTTATLFMLAGDHSHYSEVLTAQIFWALLLGALLPLSLLFLGLWLAGSPTRGYPRHWRLLSLIMAVWIALSGVIVAAILLAPTYVPAFYARSSVGPYYSGFLGLDVTVPQEMMGLDDDRYVVIEPGEDRTVPFSVGVGSKQKRNGANESEYAQLTVSAKRCTVSGREDAATWTYEEFTTDPIYAVEEKDPLIGYTVLYPTYHHTVRITFPEGDRGGTIYFDLVGYYGENAREKEEYTDETRIVLQYIIEGDWLKLYVSEGSTGK
jgi:hypothetical protein